MRGTYTLVLRVVDPVSVAVGALGTRGFPAGGYAYTGSALGPGGLDRVDRHRRVASGDHDARHWHVDYLLAHPTTEVVDAVTAPVAAECQVARRLPRGPVAGFGASDCGCRSHLAAADSVRGIREAVERAYAAFDAETED